MRVMTTLLAATAAIFLGAAAQAATVSFPTFTETSFDVDSGVKIEPDKLIFQPQNANNDGGVALFDLDEAGFGSGLLTFTVSGQNNQSATSFQFFVDDMLAKTFSFNPVGTNGSTSFTFNFDGSGDLRIQTIGGNLQGQIRGLTIEGSSVAVPGPVAGAGIPALMALGGFVWARRRKAAVPAAAV